LTQKTYGISWYEQRHGKSRWKTLLISDVAIHVQIEKGGEDSNVKNIGTPKVNDCFCAMHNVW